MDDPALVELWLEVEDGADVLAVRVEGCSCELVAERLDV